MSQQQPGQTAEGRRQLSRGMSNHEVGLSRSGSRSGSRGGTSIVHGGPSSRDALSLHGGTNTPYRHPPHREMMELYQKTLDEIRCGTEEQKRMKEEIRRLSNVVSKLEEGLKSLNDELKQMMETSFTIDNSQYKDKLNREMGILFVGSLNRHASQEEIVQVIAKVLRNEAKNKHKFNKAKTFCSNRMTDLRCEERRRLFGNKPCECFVRLTTSEFADRFLLNLKAPAEYRETYIKHLALLRKFSREGEDVKNDTYKKFRQWLNQKYTLGYPSTEEWEVALREDEGHDVPEYVPEVIHEYEIPITEDNGEDYEL